MIFALIRCRGLVRGGVAVLTALAMLAVAAIAAAAESTGPRLAAIELTERGGFKDLHNEPETSVALALVDPSTGKEKRLLFGKMGARGRVLPVPFGSPSWSPDGSLVAFAGHDGRARKDRIYVVGPDGSGLRAIPGTVNGDHPVLSPDGRTLAFSRLRYRSRVNPNFFKDFKGEPVWVYSSTTTWLVDLASGSPRRLTRWRNGLHNVPTSFSPDGSTLLTTKEDDNLEGPRVMATSLADGGSRELLLGAKEAVYSPDGSRIAFTGYLHPDLVEAEENHDYLAEELYVGQANGSGVQRLSRSKGVIESSPAWDPTGQRLAYVQARGDRSFIPGLANLFPVGNSLMQVNADGSCRQRIASRPSLAFYGVAWQPGPGHEAGPLSC